MAARFLTPIGCLRPLYRHTSSPNIRMVCAAEESTSRQCLWHRVKLISCIGQALPLRLVFMVRNDIARMFVDIVNRQHFLILSCRHKLFCLCIVVRVTTRRRIENSQSSWLGSTFVEEIWLKVRKPYSWFKGTPTPISSRCLPNPWRLRHARQ